jgi:hypothetical protein
MPTKRTRVTRTTAGQITAEVCAAWQAGDFHLLNRLLQVWPWQASPFDAVGAPPERGTFGTETTLYEQSWPRAVRLRRQLIELGGPPGRVGRHGQPLGPAKPRKKATG